MTAGAADDLPRPSRALEEMREFFRATSEVERFLLLYQFGLEEMLTKINILRQELSHRGSDCPIEHVTHRLKRPESIAEKADRLACGASFEEVRATLWDIAGIRVVCSFVTEAYTVLEMLQRQPDVSVVMVKDYIASPKPSGYQSLHLIVDIPVFLSTTTEQVRVEIQIRTVAMDFWASLEHKIHYKYAHAVPTELRAELLSVAAATERLDQQMEKLHRESRALAPTTPGRGEPSLSP